MVTFDKVIILHHRGTEMKMQAGLEMYKRCKHFHMWDSFASSVNLFLKNSIFLL